MNHSLRYLCTALIQTGLKNSIHAPTIWFTLYHSNGFFQDLNIQDTMRRDEIKMRWRAMARCLCKHVAKKVGSVLQWYWKIAADSICVTSVTECTLPRRQFPLEEYETPHHWDECSGCGYEVDSINTCYSCGNHLCKECQLYIYNCKILLCSKCLAEYTDSKGHTYMGFNEAMTYPDTFTQRHLEANITVHYMPGLAEVCCRSHVFGADASCPSHSTSLDIGTNTGLELTIGTKTSQELTVGTVTGGASLDIGTDTGHDLTIGTKTSQELTVGTVTGQVSFDIDTDTGNELTIGTTTSNELTVGTIAGQESVLIQSAAIFENSRSEQYSWQ